MYSQPSNQNYSVATGSSTTNPFVEVFFSRDPTVDDTQYPIQKRWFNTAKNTEWILVGLTSFNATLQANWVLIASANAMLGFDGGLGTTGFPVLPDTTTKLVTLTSDNSSVVITGDETTHSINFSVTPGAGFEWNSVTTDSQLMAVENGYGSNFSGLVTYTLPTVAAFGDTIKVVEIASGTMTQINVNTGQQIQMGPKFCTTSTGNVSGTYDTTNQGNCITLVCMIPNTLFVATDWVGNWIVT